MMPPGQALRRLCELAEKLGCEVRVEALRGTGGLCEIRGNRVLFIDASLDPLEQVGQTAQALCNEPGLEDVYVLPELREYLRHVRDEGPT